MTGHPENDTKRPSNRWRKFYWSIAGFLLLLPLIAMQFTDQVVWKVGDFVVFGVMLAAVGLAGEGVARKTRGKVHRSAVGIAIVAAFLLLWVNLAVGIIGNEGDTANLMYLGVLAVVVGGAFITRLRPQAMTRVMFAATIAQAGTAAIALMAGWGSYSENWPKDILGMTAFFVMLWLMSAFLFREASEPNVAPSEPTSNLR